ncbi:hypothetical protein D3C72_2347370 [compost metagenome]
MPDTPKNRPDSRPISAVRLTTEVNNAGKVSVVRATEISITPSTDTRMAIRVGTVIVSPNRTSAIRAAWAGSVRE